MGKSMIIFAFVNCPWVKNQSSRFTIDNNFFGSTYQAARYHITQGKFSRDFMNIFDFIPMMPTFLSFSSDSFSASYFR